MHRLRSLQLNGPNGVFHNDIRMILMIINDINGIM